MTYYVNDRPLPERTDCTNCNAPWDICERVSVARDRCCLTCELAAARTSGYMPDSTHPLITVAPVSVSSVTAGAA